MLHPGKEERSLGYDNASAGQRELPEDIEET